MTEGMSKASLVVYSGSLNLAVCSGSLNLAVCSDSLYSVSYSDNLYLVVYSDTMVTYSFQLLDNCLVKTDTTTVDKSVAYLDNCLKVEYYRLALFQNQTHRCSSLVDWSDDSSWLDL